MKGRHTIQAHREESFCIVELGDYCAGLGTVSPVWQSNVGQLWVPELKTGDLRFGYAPVDGVESIFPQGE